MCCCIYFHAVVRLIGTQRWIRVRCTTMMMSLVLFYSDHRLAPYIIRSLIRLRYTFVYLYKLETLVIKQTLHLSVVTASSSSPHLALRHHDCSSMFGACVIYVLETFRSRSLFFSKKRVSVSFSLFLFRSNILAMSLRLRALYFAIDSFSLCFHPLCVNGCLFLLFYNTLQIIPSLRQSGPRLAFIVTLLYY